MKKIELQANDDSTPIPDTFTHACFLSLKDVIAVVTIIVVFHTVNTESPLLE